MRFVTNVVDGDTFSTSKDWWIRLADIDTPESGESGYANAKLFLESLLLDESVLHVGVVVEAIDIICFYPETLNLFIIGCTTGVFQHFFRFNQKKNEKGRYLAKRFVLGKLHGQNSNLKKYGLEPHDPKYVTLIDI